MSSLSQGTRNNGTYGREAGPKEWQAENTSQRSRPALSTIRAVTPESEKSRDGSEISHGILGGIQASPRSISRVEKSQERRQGLVFRDSYNAETPTPGRRPPVSFNSQSRQRTRSWTKEDLPRSRSNSSTTQNASKGQHRVGSLHSTASPPLHDVQPQAVPDQTNSVGVPSALARKSPTLQKSNSVKGRRLVKKSSRPASPTSVMDDIPSIDSFPSPVATGDANKILMLMKKLCGRMRGEVEYQAVENGPWYVGNCYIDDEKGALMYEDLDSGSFHIVLISDLQGCKVKPIISLDRKVKCLEVYSKPLGIGIHLLPTVNSEYDSWLSALLCWAQIKAPPSLERQPGSKTRESYTPNAAKGGNIIKVAKLLLWDKGTPHSPTAIVRRTSTRDLRAPSRSSWRKVSCILQDNGEFRLLTENDSALLSVIQLSQLSRCSIQRLDKSVLDEEFCIAIFPHYTSTSTQLSIFRPVYIALESRLIYEVWFCLLRAFTVPDIYGPQRPASDDESHDFSISPPEPSRSDIFRIEKSISLRIIEAKVRKPAPKQEPIQIGKPMKVELDPSVGDYFVEVVLDGEVRARSITRLDSRNPFWREDYEFYDLPAHIPKLSVGLKQLEHPPVPLHGFLSSSSVHSPPQATEVVCANIELPIDKLERGKENEAWWPLIDPNGATIGEMLVRAKYEELVLLLAEDYQPLSELLHNFGSGLTVQIAQVIPTRLKVLSETLVNIFQVSGHATEWLTSLIEEEIDGKEQQPMRRLRWSRRIGSNESFTSVSDRAETVRDMGKSLQGEANLLFRGNSLLTFALDFHMRRVGKDWMEEILSEKIAEINTLNPDCEVDPSRISHGQDLNKNWSLLKAITTDFWERISSSATRCPQELRQVFKYIRAVAEDRYGNFLRSVTYTSVSGFLFLRFFCPALLNPKLFGLLRDHPQPKAQRTLTLIAKSLQALANLSTFGQKESWMEPMNKFLTTHRQGVKDFIDSVCAVSAEKSALALPASYSTPVTILARLPPTSREGFPSLPYLIDNPRNLATLVKVWLDATTTYMAPEGLEGELLEFHELCIKLQRRTDDCLLKAEEGESYSNQNRQSLQWEDVVEALESATIQDVANPTPELPSRETPTRINSGNRKPPGSSGSEIGREKRDRQNIFGRGSSRVVDPMDPSQHSPPSRAQSRNGKPNAKGFLSSLRRREKRDPSTSSTSTVVGFPDEQGDHGEHNWRGGFM